MKRAIVLAVAGGALALAGLLAAGVFQRGVKPTVERRLCDNALCLHLPAGWDGRTGSGGSWSQLTAAPFRLPSWVGQHEQGVIAIPPGRFVVLLTISDRGYLLGWPRRRAVAISSAHRRTESAWAPGYNSLARAAMTFRGRSVSLVVYFGDRRPTGDQFATVNRVLGTLHPGPPPVTTD